MFLPCPACAGEEYESDMAPDEQPTHWRCGCCLRTWLVTFQGLMDAGEELLDDTPGEKE